MSAQSTNTTQPVNKTVSVTDCALLRSNIITFVTTFKSKLMFWYGGGGMGGGDPGGGGEGYLILFQACCQCTLYMLGGYYRLLSATDIHTIVDFDQQF